MKKLLLASTLGIVCLICYSTYVYTSSTGAPIAKTGAPGESTCAENGCHTGNPIITNSSSVTISMADMNGPVSGYVPGKKYDLTVAINNGSGNAYGFEATMRDGSKAHSGVFSLANDNSVQLFGSGGTYVTHTNPYAISDGHDEWHFSWTAPSSNRGTVTLYTAVNAANGNGNSLGDHIHLQTLAIPALSSSVSEADLFNANASFYPNPVSSFLHINYVQPSSSEVNIVLMNIAGEIVKTLNEGQKSAGTHDAYLDMTGMSKGMYVVRIEAGEYEAIKKIIKE